MHPNVTVYNQTIGSNSNEYDSLLQIANMFQEPYLYKIDIVCLYLYVFIENYDYSTLIWSPKVTVHIFTSMDLNNFY
jgi:hypothetical protein